MTARTDPSSDASSDASTALPVTQPAGALTMSDHLAPPEWTESTVDVVRTASSDQVQAVQDVLGCRRAHFVLDPGQPWRCATHHGYLVNDWTERGCPVAVRAADAVTIAEVGAPGSSCGGAAGAAATPAAGETPGGKAAVTLPDEGSYSLSQAYEDGYDQGHADAHADGADPDRLCRMRDRAVAAEQALAASSAAGQSGS